MDILWFLVLVLALMAISESRLYYKNKNSKNTITIKYQDDGERLVQHALSKLNEARLTAKVNKPKQ